MSVGDDFKVSTRYREDIVDEASRWRSLDPKTAAENTFNVTEMLVNSVLPLLNRQGRKIELQMVEPDAELPLAWVDFGSSEVVFQQHVWNSALAQVPRGRLIVAHEIGHLVLHKNQVQAFSRGLEKKLDFLLPTESAESQANWFASAFLLPDQLLLRLRRRLTAQSIATITLTEEYVVLKRLEQLALDKRYREYNGNQCDSCGQLTLRDGGASQKCDNCGAEKFDAVARS